MTDLMPKAIIATLADLYSRGPLQMVHSKAVDHTDKFAAGAELVEIPSIGSVSFQTFRSTTTDSTGLSSTQYAPSNLGSFSCDQGEIALIKRDTARAKRYMGGDFYEQLVSQAVQQLLNRIDQNLCSYLVREPTYDSGATTYHDNVAADALTAADIADAQAALESLDGFKNLAYFFNPYGISSLRQISGWQPNGDMSAARGILGIPMVGLLHGIPVYSSNSVYRNRTIAGASSAISSNVLTVTVASGHGVVPGMKITTAGGTANITTAAVVSSVNATTIVAPLTSGNDATNGAVTVTVAGSENILADLNHVHFGMENLMPQYREVSLSGSAGSELQLWQAFGRIARAGRVRVIHSP